MDRQEQPKENDQLEDQKIIQNRNEETFTTILSKDIDPQKNYTEKQKRNCVEDVKNWLRTQDTYTRYKPVIRKHKYRKTFVKGLADQMQLDLVDMGKYGYKDKRYRWILTAVKILSRYAFAIPVYRKNTESMTKAVGTLFRQLFCGLHFTVPISENFLCQNLGLAIRLE